MTKTFLCVGDASLNFTILPYSEATNKHAHRQTIKTTPRLSQTSKDMALKNFQIHF
jgi:hypothetical protein